MRQGRPRAERAPEGCERPNRQGELVGPEVWLLVHRELADLARVRVGLDVLAKRARADRDRFAGRTKLS